MLSPQGQWTVKDDSAVMVISYVEIADALEDGRWTYVAYLKCTQAGGKVRQTIIDQGAVTAAADGDGSFIYKSSMSTETGAFTLKGDSGSWQSLSTGQGGQILPGWPETYPPC